MTLNDLATFLATAGAGTVGSSVFIGAMPATPDTAVAVYEYQGAAPDHVMGTAAISMEYPRVQIVARGPARDYATPRALAETAYKAMAAASAQTVGGSRFATMTPLQPPFLLRRDENERVEIAFNAELMKGLST